MTTPTPALDPHNHERATLGMPYAYADGYGKWHAVIPADRDNPEKIARALIRDELDMRGERGPGHRVRVKPIATHTLPTATLHYIEA